MATKTKYRPYLTPAELEIIILALKTTASNPHLIHYLEGYKGKIDLGINSPNLTLTPRVGIADKLGLGLEDPMIEPTSSLSDKRHSAFLKWSQNPTICTPYEIELAYLYRFENDLMSPEEETIYLESQGVPAK